MIEDRRAYQAAYREKHRAAINARQREWRRNNPAKSAEHKRRYYASKPQQHCLWSRKSRLKRLYGLTVEEMERLRNQGCWLCGDAFTDADRIVIDHDHATGETRGVAHDRCNCLIGYAKEDPALLRKIADRLQARDLQRAS